MTSIGEHRYEIRATAESHFSWLRTRLSLERTLMSWVRTSVALVGFGFTIVQFFERFGTMQGVAPPLSPEAPRLFGLTLICAGSLALAISVWQYWATVRYLWRPDFRPIAEMHKGELELAYRTPIFVIAVIVGCVGVFALLSVFTRFI